MKRMVQHYNVETFTHFTHGRMNEINHIQTNINSKRRKIRIYTSVIFKDSKQQWNIGSKERKLKLPFSKLLNIS